MTEAEGLIERLRLQAQHRGVGQPSDLLNEAATAIQQAISERDEARGVLDREERAMSQVIGERDEAEDVIGKMFTIVTGDIAEWSNMFGYAEALDAAEAQLQRLTASLEDEREACAKVAETEGVYPELNVWNGGPAWFKHGKNIAAAIRARKDKP